MIAQSDPATTEPLARLHATVHGHVQGVGFRYFVRDQAQRLALRGWVRNCDNGDVELEAEGPRPQLERLLRAVQRGPSAAHVTSVDVIWGPHTGRYTGFEVRVW